MSKLSVNNTYFTPVKKRTSIGGTSSEVAQLKGIRYAVMTEPRKNDTINEGIMKEITGEDEIQARHLRQEAIVFVPQFTLCCMTNYLFNIKLFLIVFNNMSV